MSNEIDIMEVIQVTISELCSALNANNKICSHDLYTSIGQKVRQINHYKEQEEIKRQLAVLELRRTPIK